MNNEQTQTIHGQIIRVCRYLTTKYSAKKHGGYKIYSDEKISATLDTYVPNVSLSVLVNGQPIITVFSCNYNGDTYIYKPGAWEGYLKQLDKEARKSQDKKAKAAEKKRKAELKEKFGPVSAKLNAIFK
jgi:hypothetical protein